MTTAFVILAVSNLTLVIALTWQCWHHEETVAKLRACRSQPERPGPDYSTGDHI